MPLTDEDRRLELCKMVARISRKVQTLKKIDSTDRQAMNMLKNVTQINTNIVRNKTIDLETFVSLKSFLTAIEDVLRDK